MDAKPIGYIHHVCIQTSNFEKAFEFYTQALGLGIVKPPFIVNGERQVSWINADPIIIELNGLKRGTEDKAQEYSSFGFGPSHIAFVVEDLDVTIERLEKHQIPIVRRPFLPPTGIPNQPRVAFIEGPDKDHIELREVEK